MGEIFDRPAPSQELEWTGERLTSAVSGQIEIEHLHRYFFARTFCRGMDVLDVASGEGYGSSLLAQVARSVVGVEIDPAAVTHAARAYSRPNLSYVNGDARAIPLPDACVDVVVSFETLEHFFEHDAFLNEVKRVLRPGGRFVISSPDRDVYSPLGSSANPYHVNELTRHEFERLLAGHFRHCAMFLQRPVLGSVLFPEDRAQGVLTFERRGDRHYEASLGIPRAPYNVVVASETALDDVQASVFFETSAIGEVLSQVEGRAIELEAFARERAQYEEMLLGTRGELRSAEAGTRSALARAERAEEALNRLAQTCSVEIDTLAAGLRGELGALSLALDRHLARGGAGEGTPQGQWEQTIATLREHVRQADEVVKGQVSRVAGFVQGLSAAIRVRQTLRHDLEPVAAAPAAPDNGTPADPPAGPAPSPAAAVSSVERGGAPGGGVLTASSQLADPEPSEAATAGNTAVQTPDQAEIAHLRQALSAVQTQIATLQSQKDALGLSYRIQSSLVHKLRHTGNGVEQNSLGCEAYVEDLSGLRLENEQLKSEIEVLRSLFEHTRGSIEGALRISGARLLPKSTRTWLRRKIYGPRWIR